MTRTRNKSWVVFLLFCVVIAGGIQILGCQTPETAKAGPQHITLLMQPALVGGTTKAEYFRLLSAGEPVVGDVTVFGEWDWTDMTPPWIFEVINPAGVVIDSATINTVPFADDVPYYHFNFTADAGGKYLLRVIHYSAFVKNLDMVVSPAGWQLETPAT